MSAPIGRSVELERARRFLEDARRRFTVLVLEGEAGIGKTVVFEETLRMAEQAGMLVLRSRAAQAEAKMALSVVADLLEPLPAELFEQLPPPQRRAIDVALLRSDPGEETIRDRALAAALRDVLASLSRERPVLVAIDDLHWLDAASGTVLGHALRRLTDEPIGLLATRRTGEPVPLGIEDLGPREVATRHPIGPLTMGSLHHLLREQLGQTLSRPALVRLHQATGGNPLFALEIGRVLADGGPLPAGQPLPIPADVETLVRTRVLDLPVRARVVLAAAAAVAFPSESLVAAAAGHAIGDELALAEERGIAMLTGEVVRFRHPLFAAAVYQSIPPAERRRLHATLASLVPDAQERARHLALSVDGRDEAAAREVHAVAKEAAQRGAATASVELLELAISIGDPDEATAAERLFDLADKLALVGDNARALELLGSVDPWTGWPKRLHGDALEIMIELTYWIHGPGPQLRELGESLLGRALPLEARAQVHAALAQYTEDDLERAMAYSEAALRDLDRIGAAADPRVRATALAFRARNRLVLGEGLDRGALDEALALDAAAAPRPSHLTIGTDGAGQWLKYADAVDDARVLLTAGLERDLALGYEKSAMNRLQHLALTECLAGNLDLANAHALRACELHDLERNRVLGYAYPILAIVAAHRGDIEVVHTVRDMYRAQGSPIHLLVALGLAELSLGNDEAAFEHLGAALDAQERAGLREPGIHRIHANAAEAAVALGELDRATAITDELVSHGERVGHRWSRAAGARCRALLQAARGGLAAAVATAGEAVALHDELAMPFERARTLLVKGAIERRVRQRSEAHRSLSEAAAAFESMGARVWAERARTELARVGLRRSSGDELTEGERRCAELAAAGMTNREVAAALFISPKTVEANLARAYRKLGITSRAQLGARMGESPQT